LFENLIGYDVATEKMDLEIVYYIQDY